MNRPRRRGPWNDRAWRSFGSRDRREGHAAARRLLAHRMDGTLDPAAAAQLAAHLEGCPRCRSVAHAYEESREALRALRPTVPPRDLRARVSAALDREISGRNARLASVPRPGAALVGTAVAASSAVAVLVIGARLLLAPATGMLEPDATAAAVAPRPTPFTVPSTELALVEIGSDGLTVYRTAVDWACPPTATDCATSAYESRQVTGVPGDLVPRGVALDRTSRRMALLAEDALGADTVSVVVLPPMDPERDPRRAGPGPDGLWPGRGDPVTSQVAPGSLAPAPSASPADAPVRMLAILEDVQAVGAPPAWSPDGGVLAFSAMPSDRSQGPDVYIWRPGQSRAHRLTSDHSSWFASWSGSRIVLSRLERADGHGTAQTILVDPEDGREQVARLAGAWLPSVDPSGRFAVAWRGTLVGGGTLVRPRTGGLALIDWSAVDPEAAGDPAPDLAGPSAAPLALAPGAPPEGLPAGLRPVIVHARGGMLGAQTVTRHAVVAPDASDRSAAWLESVEAGIDGTPLALDWQVRWATSGTTFGYWVADARGASWGRLTVVRVLPDARRIDRGAVLLGPTLARRSFSLGAERVAWVAPADEGADGELRVRTWGEPGEGNLRMRDIRLRNGIPAF